MIAQEASKPWRKKALSALKSKSKIRKGSAIEIGKSPQIYFLSLDTQYAMHKHKYKAYIAMLKIQKDTIQRIKSTQYKA